MDQLDPRLLDKVLGNLGADDIKSALRVNKNWKEATKQHIKKRPELSHTPDISELHALHEMPLPIFFGALCWYLATQSLYGVDMIKHYVRVFRDVALNRCIACLVPLMVLSRVGSLYLPLLFTEHGALPASLVVLAAVSTAVSCTPLPSRVRHSPLFAAGVALMTVVAAGAETTALFLSVRLSSPTQALSVYSSAVMGLAWLLVLPSAVVFAAADHFEVDYDSIPPLTTPLMSGWFSLHLLFALTALLRTATYPVLVGLTLISLTVAGVREISRALVVQLPACLLAACLVCFGSEGISGASAAQVVLVGISTFSCAVVSRALAFGPLLPRRSALVLTGVTLSAMFIANTAVR